MFDPLRKFYRRMLTTEVANTFAWKSAYAGKWDKWCQKHRSDSVFTHPRELHAHILNLERLKGPINYLEFGVHKGESLAWWLEKNHDPDSKFIGFDSFQGLPEDWKPNFLKGHFANNGNPPEVRDTRCSFEVGWFHETLPHFVERFSFNNPTIINLDADLYSSSILVLCLLSSKFKPNDILILDDFSDPLHVFRAFTDFLSAFPVEYNVLARHPRYNRIAVQILKVPRSNRNIH